MSRNGQWARAQLLRWGAPGIGLALFALWEAAGRMGLVSPLFFPAPSVIIDTLVRLFGNGELTANVLATVTRVMSGFLLGGLLGLSLGMLMGWSASLRQVVDPLVAAVHPIPKISIFPLIMIIFGIGVLSKTLVVAIAAFFPMVINTMAGVRQISPIYLEVADNYGAGPWKVFTRVILPASSPMILAGVRLALNLSLTITTSVELLMAQDGLGSMIWLSWQTLRIEELYAAVVALAAIGILFRFTIVTLTKRLVPWQSRESA